MGMDGSEQTAGTTQPVMPGGRHARVLMTNAYGPYDLKWGQSPSDLLGARLARGHNMLERSAILPTWSLYLMAENISNPTTVLEYPRWDDFVAAVREGYDLICIETKTMQIPRIARMVRTIREIAPKTKILMGGYGVSTLHEGVPSDPERLGRYLLDTVDYFCRTEGVSFMRRLLDDAPFDRPITQYTLPPSTVHPYGSKTMEINLPAILCSLGCPSACDFCNTSAFFHYKKISVASPAQVYDFMKHHQRTLKKDDLTFVLFDEDIFLDPAYVRELGRLIRSDKKTWGFRWISFGSMKALQPFTPRELRECGVEGIWIGVESGLTEDNANKAEYSKRVTSITPTELFANLRQVGVQTIGSMILGLDFHTKDNIEKDIDFFVSLRPTLYQIGPIRPCPGTKLYKLMTKDKKIKQNYGWEDFHLWEANTHTFQNFSTEEIRHWFDVIHNKLKNTNGSPVLQIFECDLLACETFRNDPSPFLRYQSKLDRGKIRGLYPVIRGLQLTAPSPEVAARAKALLKHADRILKDDNIAFTAFRRIATPLVSVGIWRSERKHQPTPAQWAPDMRRTPYRQGAKAGARVGA